MGIQLDGLQLKQQLNFVIQGTALGKQLAYKLQFDIYTQFVNNDYKYQVSEQDQGVNFIRFFKFLYYTWFKFV